MPANGVIQIAFDRLLLPATAVRQSFILIDGDQNALEPLVTYDPVRRVVTLSDPGNGGWLKPGQPYSIFFGIAKPGDDESGLRAIDGAPLNASSAGEIGFLTANATTVAITPDAKSDFCNDVLPVFSGRCATQLGCHTSPQSFSTATASAADNERFPNGISSPAAGLILDTAQGVVATAIGRVAQGSNTGGSATSEAPGSQFGIDMPIVDPGNPSNSWLMYKLLLAEPQDADGGTVLTNQICTNAPSPTNQPPPLTQYELLQDDERARLSNYVLGNQMPYPPNPGVDNRSQNLTMDELERVRAWISAGAVVTDCSVCSQ